MWDLCHANWFGHIATAFILANTVVFAIQYADQPDGYAHALEVANLGEQPLEQANASSFISELGCHCVHTFHPCTTCCCHATSQSRTSPDLLHGTCCALKHFQFSQP